MGSGVEKRRRMTTIRAARMRREGYTLTQIAEATGIPRERLQKRIQLGERLISVEATGKPK